MNASPRSDFAPAEPHRGRAALNAAGSTIQHRMAGAGDQPDDQALTAFDRDRHPPSASPNRASSLNSALSWSLGVLDQPSAHHRTVVIDEAHPVLVLSPNPIHRTSVDLQVGHRRWSRADRRFLIVRPSPGLLSRADHARPATTRATSSNRPSSGETSRPSLAAPDEQANLARTPIVIQ